MSDALDELRRRVQGSKSRTGILERMLGVSSEDIDRLKGNMDTLIKEITVLTEEIRELNKKLDALLEVLRNAKGR